MLTIDNAVAAATEFVAAIPRYPGHFHGRGVVTCAGGVKYLTCAWVQMALLRRLGCTLPIEVWYLGEDEGDTQWIDLVRPLGVECVNAFEVRHQHPHPRLGGWQAKAYAVLHSRFQEVLFLDADNVPVVDPSFLFASPEYRETGALFWPDTAVLSRARQAWRVFGVPFRPEYAFESGQLLIDKRRSWQALQLCDWYNRHSDFFYQFVHGDKDTFHFAWHRLDQPFTLVPVPAAAAPFGVIQFDPAGERLFQHRMRDKWLLRGNRRYPEFQHEDACIECLRELAERWDPALHLTRHLAPRDRLQMQALAEKSYRFIHAGSRTWPVQLGADGRVTAASRLLEQFWWCAADQLVFAGADGRVTALLDQQADGTWQGRSSVRGQGDVRLVRLRRAGRLPLGDRKLWPADESTVAGRSPVSLGFAWPGATAGRKTLERMPAFIDLPGRCFNPSILRHQGRWLLAYRQSLGDTENDIYLTYLDAQFRPVGESKRLEIPPAVPMPSCWEDPRLFYCRDRLFCSFTYWVPGLGSDRTAVGVCELSPAFEVCAVRFPRHGFNHNACVSGSDQGQEKNWVFFEHEEQLYFLYDTVPLEVVAYDFDRDATGATMRTWPALDWFWGKIRGGTPPVRLGDCYYSFFHSALRHQGRWTYYAGLVTFRAELPFRIHQISSQPLLAGQWEAGADKSVIFPGGAVYEQGWTIACGVNDRRCALFTFSHDEVTRDLVK
jgi:predicted GH43/DUF377 family glycosyl hydrolase